MGILLPKLTPEELDELANEFVFFLVYCGVEKREDLIEEKQTEYDEWEKKQEQSIE
jgi:hypothetical protein